MLRPLLPALRSGLADLLAEQDAHDGDLQVVVATGDDLTRSLPDGTHPPAVPVGAGEARTALPAGLRPLGGPDLRVGAARLLGAVGDELAARDEDDRPERVVVLLVGEGAVGDTSAVRDRIAHQQATYAWEFVLVDVTTGTIPSTAGARAAASAAAESRGEGGDAAVAVVERPAGDGAERFGVPATATITAGPGAAGVSAAMAAASAFVSRARAARPHEPVEGFSDAERAAADVPDTRPGWRRLLRLP
ncbi:hypothetical protein [Pseudonocardia sp. ICBG1293]|uniref:hypothetical protein n=1 Tax=Pseudonocardia sp. ICBG1293 TaxID=2844382 RepID=UPI001CCBA081|nr:hypothetical protein [Pseudonocardia sp. ICBG1293]